MTKPQFATDLVAFIQRILNKKLHSLYGDNTHNLRTNLLLTISMLEWGSS